MNMSKHTIAIAEVKDLIERGATTFSVIFSVFSGIVGLAVSYYTNVATGPMIVIIASVIYFSTFIFGRKLKK